MTYQENTQTNQRMSVQMERIADFFGAPEAPFQRKQNLAVIQ